MPYKNYLISDFKTGKDIEREPWLTPPDAFPTLENARTDKGVLEKRLGFSPFATMVHGEVEQTDTAILGIHTYLDDGSPELLVMDNKRVNLFGVEGNELTDISGDLITPTDIFSSGDSDFFSFVNWQNIGYFVNNIDQIYQYAGSGAAAIPFDYQFDSEDPTENQLDTCRHLFIKDDRMFFLDTVEFGTRLPQRLRFTPTLQTDGTQAGGGFIDAPTEHVICSAGMSGNNIAVFMTGDKGGSFWEIQNTSNTDVPYRWKKISDLEGCRSPYSAVQIKAGQDLRDGLASVGISNILFYDGFRLRDLDEPKLRDIVETFSNSDIASIYSYYQFEKRRLLISYTNEGSDSPNYLLEYNCHENSWAIHNSNQSFFINCMGGFNDQAVPTWLQADDAFGIPDALMQDAFWSSDSVPGSPKPYTLIGCRNSQIYKWQDGEFDATDDANGNIPLLAKSSRLNPFVKDGSKVALGSVKVFVDNDSAASFNLKLFKNTSDTPYKTQVVSCDGTNDKFWTSVFADGEVGDFHRIEVSHDARGNTPRIHAFDLEMRPSGRLDV